MTPRPAPPHTVYPYLLRNLTVTHPDQVWASDITYIPLPQGFMHLVAAMDWYSRRVLYWRLSKSLSADFCCEALRGAPIARPTGPVCTYATPGTGRPCHRTGSATDAIVLLPTTVPHSDAN